MLTYIVTGLLTLTEGSAQPLNVRPFMLPTTPAPVPPAPAESFLPSVFPFLGENLSFIAELIFDSGSSVFAGSFVVTGLSFCDATNFSVALVGFSLSPGVTILSICSCDSSGSPCGAGVGQMSYYYDGNVYTCDEGRMLSEMGDNSFLLGNVHTNTFQECVSSPVCAASLAMRMASPGAVETRIS